MQTISEYFPNWMKLQEHIISDAKNPMPIQEINSIYDFKRVNTYTKHSQYLENIDDLTSNNTEYDKQFYLEDQQRCLHEKSPTAKTTRANSNITSCF